MPGGESEAANAQRGVSRAGRRAAARRSQERLQRRLRVAGRWFALRCGRLHYG